MLEIYIYLNVFMKMNKNNHIKMKKKKLD